jgi:hypothetical protein
MIRFFGLFVLLIGFTASTRSYESNDLEWLVEPILEYDEVQPFSEGLAVVRKGSLYTGKYGYINIYGEEVIPCIYQNAKPFKGDLAKVQEDGKWGFINKENWKIISLSYDVVGEFSEGLLNVRRNNSWGYIDTNEKLILTDPYWTEIRPFSEGLAAVKANTSYAFINKKKKYVISHSTFNGEVTDFSEGKALVTSVNGKLRMYINKKSKRLSFGGKGFNIYGGYDLNFFDKGSESFKNGYAKVKYSNKYGFISKTKLITPLIYDDAESFSEGFAVVKKNYKYGFINTYGKEIIHLLYDKVESFSNGLAKVEKSGKRGFINKEGEYIYSCYECTPYEYTDGLIRVFKDGQYQFINNNGKTLIKIEADEIQHFSEGVAFVRKSGKWGIIKNPTYKSETEENQFIAKKSVPKIQWTNPSKNGVTYTDGKSLTISICINTPKQSDTKYKLFIDDKLVVFKGIVPENDSVDCNYTIKHNLSLRDKGVYNIKVEVENKYGKVVENKIIHAVYDNNIQPTLDGKYYLFLIGIDDYDNWQDLNNPKNDALAVKQLLTNRYTFSSANTTMIFNTNATKQKIFNQLEKLNKKLNSNDHVLIFYSGHGVYNEDRDEGYWIPYDAPNRNFSNEHISYTEINNKLCNLNCQNVYLIADNCYGSDLIRGISEIPYLNKRSRSTLVAGSGAVLDGTLGKNSPFTTALLSFLSDNNEKYLPASFIEPHIRLSVAKATNGNQTPEYGRNQTCEGIENDGDFVFMLR